MPSNPVDPLSPQALAAGNTYSQAVKDRIADLLSRGAGAVGRTLLGENTGNDATAGGQEAYRQYSIDAQTQGQQPMSMQQFMMQRSKAPPPPMQ